MEANYLEGGAVAERIADALENMQGNSEAINAVDAKVDNVAASVTAANAAISGLSSSLSSYQTSTNTSIQQLSTQISGTTAESLGVVSYKADQLLTQGEQERARNNLGMSDVDLTSNNVKYTAQNLTEPQKEQARANIGLNNINDLVSDVVKYTEQTLTDPQKAQARTNIGLGNINEMVSGVVKYSEQQTLTTEQQSTARSNIGLGDISSMVEGTVKYSETQSLTDDQKSTARSNIGLGNINELVTGTVKYEAQTLTPEQQEQARTNIGLSNLDSLTSGTVKYNSVQNLSSSEKRQGRENIDAASSAEVQSVQNLLSGGVVSEIATSNNGLTVSYTDGTSDEVAVGGAALRDVDYDSGNYLHFYDANGGELFEGPFLIQGGGATGYSVQVENSLSSSVLTVASGQNFSISFIYKERYGADLQNQNGFMTVQYKLATENDDQWKTLISDQQIPANVPQRVDVSKILGDKTTTNILVTCSNGRSGDDASSNKLQYNITTVEMSISSTFNQSATYSGNFSLSYTCIGRKLKKTLHCTIDGETYEELYIGTSHNEASQLPINLVENYSYGAHELKLWFVTDEGAVSNVLSYIIMYDDGTGSAPIIGAQLEKNTIEISEVLNLNYMCYTPGKETTANLSVRVYSTDNGNETEYYNASFENIPNNIIYSLPITDYQPLGNGFVELTSEETVVTLPFTVTEIQSDYDLSQVSSGLVYLYRPTGYTNNTSGKEQYVYTITDAAGNNRNIYTYLNDFNYVTDGYLDGESLTLSGAARLNINMPILSTSYENEDRENVVLDAASGATVTTNGRTIEFDFELSNVTDQNDIVFKCLNNNGVGFVITPQVCYLCADGQSPIFDSTGFIENEENLPCAYIKDEKRIRVTFVIQRKKYTNDERFISYANIFINGEYANSYPYDDDAVYNSKASIEIGSSSCVTKLYGVRMYNRDLNKEEVLRNMMNASVDMRARIAQNEYNDILDSNNDIDYTKARLKYPCLLFIGRLSNYKNDKQNVGVVLTKPDGLGGYKTEFSLLDKDSSNKFASSIKVQGTSSQRFMRKNFKVSLAKMNSEGTGTEKVKYALKGLDTDGQPLSVPESTLCYKIDYMSTDHANTFNANIADTLFNDHASDDITQNTIYGFRCLLFNLAAEDYSEGIAFENYPEGTILFAGDGCLNNDKSNSKSFGLETPGDHDNVTTQQKWEFKDNTSSLCTFKTDRFMQKIYSEDGTFKRQVKYGLESCYPDEGDLEKAGLEPDYSHIQILFTWVYQRANYWEASTESGTGGTYNGRAYNTERQLKKAIFDREFALHFNMEHSLVYYLFIEWVALCDNRAKNMFLSSKDVTVENIVFTDNQVQSVWDIVNDETGAVDASKINWEASTFCVWYTDLYDLDSCFGAENSGYIRIPYYADWNYVLGRNGSHQFNGHDSRLWCMFEESFASQIKARAQLLTRSNTGSGTLNYSVLKQVHITDNAELVCPAVVNEDMEYKYEDPWTIGYWDYSLDEANPTWVQTKDYKYLQRGSRTEQKENFIYRRCNMLYSKYQCDQFLNDQIAFRCGSAVSQNDSAIALKPVQVMWLGVQYGDSGTPVMSGKKNAGEQAVISTTNLDGVGRSDNVHIFGASNLTEISSLAAFHPYEIGLTNAKKLKTLLIGSDEEGYSNGDLTSLNTNNCPLLETLNIQNCTGIENPINMEKNTLIREVYANGSTVPYFSFKNGGVLETLELGSPTRIILLNQSYFDKLTYSNLSRLSMLWIEDTPNTGVLDILKESIENLRLGIRLVNINETVTGTDYSLFKKLVSSAAQGKRLNADGTLDSDTSAWPVITGTINVETIGTRTLAMMNEYYPDLTINAANTTDQFLVTFKNADNTNIKDKYGVDYVQWIDRGSSAYDPIAANEVNTPTMADDNRYVYTFSGWDNLSGVVRENKTVTARYSTSEKTYTVRWFAKEGILLKTAENVAYGSDLAYSNDPYDFPTLTDQESAFYYKVFKGWNKSTGFVDHDIDAYAIWEGASLPEPGQKAMKDMNIAEISGVAKRNEASSYWSTDGTRDYIDVRVGKDFNFEGIQSQVLADEMYLDGSSIHKTAIKLFDANAPTFTMAIDFEFSSTTPNGTLVSCFESDGSEGFRLRYSESRPTIQWGNNNQNVGYGMSRGIVVIRHRQGENNLYVASDNVGNGVYNDTIIATEIPRTVSTETDAVLSFGGVPVGTSGSENLTSGIIHWCKIWYADLGITAINQLACWPHETWRMEYTGTGLYYLSDGSGQRCAATFIANAPLSNMHSMNSSGSAYGGWTSSSMRNFTNGRLFDAMPYEWQAMIKTVRVRSTDGTNSGNIVNSSDKIYLPSYVEMSPSTEEPFILEGETIPWFAFNRDRIKYAGIIIPPDSQRFETQYDPTTSSLTTVKDGDVWIRTNNSNRGYIYVSAAEAAKHGRLGGRNKTSDYNIVAEGSQGGYWVFATPQWTRTAPPATDNYYFYYVMEYGWVSPSGNAASLYAINPMYSI